MPQKRKTSSNEEWLEVIQQCRASGLPDREWCQIQAFADRIAKVT